MKALGLNVREERTGTGRRGSSERANVQTMLHEPRVLKNRHQSPLPARLRAFALRSRLDIIRGRVPHPQIMLVVNGSYLLSVG